MPSQSQLITRKSASNLALAFILLPKPRRDAMAALYAFCREVDDVADNESVPIKHRRDALNLWREDVRNACSGRKAEFLINQELQPAIQTYRLPFHLFDELLLGMEMDLEINRYQTYDDLEIYCYRVASVVGLLSIEIFGYQDPACKEYAVYLGKALQLTNILRDVHTDAERGRIYLPQEACARHQVSEQEILQGMWSERFAHLAKETAGHARSFYGLARQTLPATERRAMAAAELMGSVYWRLLRKLEKADFHVFQPQPIRVTKGGKIMLIFRTWCRLLLGSATPNYGIP